jgi:YtkA-like
MRGLRPAAVVGALSVAGLALPAFACPTTQEGFRRLASADAEVAYRLEPAELKVGQFFTAEAVACRAPGAEPVDAILIDATMPAHGHGMNYRPAAVRAAPGHYRFTGLMLHMPGTWQVTIDLVQGAKRTRLTHEVKLAP